MPKKHTLFGEKRFKRISSRGVFTRPKLMLAGRLKGKIVKQYHGLVASQERARLTRLIDSYQKKLAQIGITVLPTEIKFGISLKNGKSQLKLIQPLVPEKAILLNYLKTCNGNEALLALEKTLEALDKIKKFNSKGETKIGIDATLSNLAIINGKITLIDIYPAFLKNAEEITTNEILDRVGQRSARILKFILPKNAYTFAEKRINQRLNAQYMQKRITLKFQKLRPELKPEFIKIMNKWLEN